MGFFFWDLVLSFRVLGSHPKSCERYRAAPSQAAFGVDGSGLRVWCLGLSVQDLGFRVKGSGFRVWGVGCRVKGAGFKV